jgi:hypothetical protein
MRFAPKLLKPNSSALRHSPRPSCPRQSCPVIPELALFRENFIADAKPRLLAQLIGGLSRNQPLPERKQDNIGVTFEVERPHDVILVEHHCLFADIKNAADFFHGASLREQL